MDTDSRHHRLALVLAATALVVSVGASGAPALAKVVFANNSDKVDGRHAVGAGTSIKHRAGKLVATKRTNGRLPNDIIRKAPDAARLDGRDSADFLSLDAPAGRLVAEGRVNTDGSLVAAAGAGVSTSRSATGQYAVTVAGLNPGCAHNNDNLLATPFGVSEVSVNVITTVCDPGDVTFGLSTRTSGGTAVDGNFFFAIFKGGPVTSSPPSRSRPGGPSVCVIRASGERCQ